MAHQPAAKPPFAHDSQEIGEQPRLDTVLGVAEERFQQVARELVVDFLLAPFADVGQAVVVTLADDGGVLGLGGDVGGGENEPVLVGESGGEPLRRHLRSVTTYQCYVKRLRIDLEFRDERLLPEQLFKAVKNKTFYPSNVAFDNGLTELS